jgi:hypothetical protein
MDVIAVLDICILATPIGSKVEKSFLDNDLADSIEVISQEKLDFCHIN